MNLSIRLTNYKNQLEAFWGDATKTRFEYIVKIFHFDKNLDFAQQVKNHSNTFQKALKVKVGRDIGDDERRIIYGLFWALSEFDKEFPLIDATWPRDDSEAYKGICRNLGKQIFWALAQKKRHDTPMETKEPLQIISEDEGTGPHYLGDHGDELLYRCERGASVSVLRVLR